MTLSRRAAWFCIAFAAWNTFVWVTFVRNVYPDHHFDAFFRVHAAIGGLTTVLGLGVGLLGVRALAARRQAQRAADPAQPAGGVTARGRGALR